MMERIDTKIRQCFIGKEYFVESALTVVEIKIPCDPWVIWPTESSGYEVHSICKQCFSGIQGRSK